MTTLLTGANGFVGARIKEAMNVVSAPTLKNATEDDIKRLIDEVKPDVIVNTAAISDIPTCEKNPDASYHANVLIPQYFARNLSGAKLICFSTDQVYIGNKNDGPFEENETCPVNLYSKHKLEMEKTVLDIDENSIMLRATWMYDMPIYNISNRSNFIVSMINSAINNQTVYYSNQTYRGITYVREVAEMIPKIINLKGGSYNFGSENDLTLFQTAKFFSDELNLGLEIKNSSQMSNLWMNCNKLKSNGLSFKSTSDGLKKCIKDYNLDLFTNNK